MAENNKRTGFTLIELLVVIAIMGILTSFLLPALSTVLDKAKQTNCRNQLVQMGRALKLYQQDNGRGVLYPEFDGSPFLLKIYGGSKFQIQEHTIFICPSTADDNLLGQNYDKIKTGDSNNEISYAGRKNKNQAEYPGAFKLNQNTSNTSIAADDFNQPVAINLGDETNHVDSANFLFLDLHVDSENTFNNLRVEFLYDPLTN